MGTKIATANYNCFTSIYCSNHLFVQCLLKYVRLKKNGSFIQNTNVNGGNGTAPYITGIMDNLPLSVGDYLTLEVFDQNDSATEISGSVVLGVPMMSMRRNVF
jgi:hypothetical protein